MIKKIDLKYINQVAKIHKENLPSFLSAFPLSFIEKFYTSQLNLDKNLLIGSFDGEAIEGFVFGTQNVDELYKSFIANHTFYFLYNVGLVFLFNPKYLLLFASKFFNKSFVSDCKRQLVYISVNKKLNKKGIGRNLLNTFETYWDNYEHYELEVESNNPAFNFYQKNGFYIVHEYNNWIEKKILMRKDLP